MWCKFVTKIFNVLLTTVFMAVSLNSENFDMHIKRDGKGMPLPVALQDMAQLGAIEGFEPRIIEIQPVTVSALPILSELREQFEHVKNT